jgi:hypothetical protein
MMIDAITFMYIMMNDGNMMSDGCLMSDGESSFTVGNNSKFRY